MNGQISSSCERHTILFGIDLFDTAETLPVKVVPLALENILKKHENTLHHLSHEQFCNFSFYYRTRYTTPVFCLTSQSPSFHYLEAQFAEKAFSFLPPSHERCAKGEFSHTVVGALAASRQDAPGQHCASRTDLRERALYDLFIWLFERNQL